MILQGNKHDVHNGLKCSQWFDSHSLFSFVFVFTFGASCSKNKSFKIIRKKGQLQQNLHFVQGVTNAFTFAILFALYAKPIETKNSEDESEPLRKPCTS